MWSLWNWKENSRKAGENVEKGMWQQKQKVKKKYKKRNY